MLFEKVFHQSVYLGVQLFEALDLRHILVQNGLENHLGQLSESVVVVVFTYRKVYIVSRHSFLQEFDYDLQEPELLLVLVTISQYFFVRVHAVVQFHKLNHEVGAILVHDQAID